MLATWLALNCCRLQALNSLTAAVTVTSTLINLLHARQTSKTYMNTNYRKQSACYNMLTVFCIYDVALAILDQRKQIPNPILRRRPNSSRHETETAGAAGIIPCQNRHSPPLSHAYAFLLAELILQGFCKGSARVLQGFCRGSAGVLQVISSARRAVLIPKFRSDSARVLQILQIN